MKPVPNISMLVQKLNFRSNKGTTPFDRLYSSTSRENIDFDVYLPTKGFNLQRPFVWTLHQRQQLIISILKETPIPTVAVIRHTDTNQSESVFQVIDGKQRIKAYIDYCDGLFAVPIGEHEYLYEELPKEMRWTVQNFTFSGDLAYSYGTGDGTDKDYITDDDKIRWFNQRNFAGTEQEEDHITKLNEALVH